MRLRGGGEFVSLLVMEKTTKHSFNPKYRFGFKLGKRFGRLVVQGFVKSRGDIYRVTHAVCLCDCGQTANVLPTNLRAGRTKSCGCLGRLAWAWHKIAHMRKNLVCKRWRKFGNFAKDVKPQPKPGYILMRLDKAKPYSSKNHRWGPRFTPNAATP